MGLEEARDHPACDPVMYGDTEDPEIGRVLGPHSMDHTQNPEEPGVLSSRIFLHCSHCILLLNPLRSLLYGIMDLCVSQPELPQSRDSVDFLPLHLGSLERYFAHNRDLIFIKLIC